jgi:hypothetical protein
MSLTLQTPDDQIPISTNNQLVKSLFTVNYLASGCTKLAGPSGNRAKGALLFH